jgi:hypothetical protein
MILPWRSSPFCFRYAALHLARAPAAIPNRVAIMALTLTWRPRAFAEGTEKPEDEFIALGSNSATNPRELARQA